MPQDTRPSQPSDKAIVALGGNLDSHVGGPKATIEQSFLALTKLGLTVEKVSKFYTTRCFPAGAGPDYVNAAILVSGETDPKKLLETLHQVEGLFGRIRKTRWAGRTLDLDLLAHGERVLPDLETFKTWHELSLEKQQSVAPDGLILPHPRIQDRGFVLVPACDVAPNWRHPVLQKTLNELKNSLPKTELDGISEI